MLRINIIYNHIIQVTFESNSRAYRNDRLKHQRHVGLYFALHSHYFRHQILSKTYWLACCIPVSTQKHLFNITLYLIVLDRVRHFRPIPIHRFFAVNRCRYRCDTDVFALTRVIIQEGTWRSVTERSKAPDAAAATNNSSRCTAGRLRGGGCLWSVMASCTVKHSNY